MNQKTVSRHYENGCLAHDGHQPPLLRCAGSLWFQQKHSLPTLQCYGTSFLPVRRQVSWNEVRSNSPNAYRKVGSSLCFMGWGAIMHSCYYCPLVHLGNRCCATDLAPSYSGRNHVVKINTSWASFSVCAFDEIHGFEHCIWNRLEADWVLGRKSHSADNVHIKLVLKYVFIKREQQVNAHIPHICLNCELLIT